MHNTSYRNLMALTRSIAPLLMIIGGGVGVLYTLAVPQGNSVLLVTSILILLGGVSFYTYLEIMESEVFRRRFGLKTQKKSGSGSGKRHKKTGKKCPKCEKIIYNKRTVCQHCGYKFASFKEGDETDENAATEETEDKG